MGTTLQHGIFLPAEGERNCYAGLASNWTILDGVVGGYSSHAANFTIHVTAADKEAWNGKADASALTAHTGNTTIHVTAADKEAWNGKADDNSVVHKSGNETIAGTKTFTDNNMIKTSSPKVLLINTSQSGNTAPSSNAASFLRFDGGTVNNFGGVQCEFLTTGENRLTNYVNDITKAKVNTIQQRANSTTAMTVFNADLLVPATDGVTALGNSSKRLKDCQTYLINGLTPSSLSLPSNTSIDISGYITDFSGGNNQYTALDNGIVAVDISGTNRYVLYNNNLSIGDCLTGTNFRHAGIIQVRKNDSVVIQSDGGTLNYAKFIPCQGNV